ncbi:hypothetical protein F4604DRAFT_258865 [Suillus subluteus]|nr:hypothetical protein F4604DRAFT_258865 [Suillus subluteus]
MNQISNDRIWWPVISSWFVYSYHAVASSTVVVYDWSERDYTCHEAITDILICGSSALTSGQEFELVWSQPWSLITVMYLGVRFLGVIYCGTIIMWSLPTVSVTDTVGNILSHLLDWTPAVVMVMLGVVMILRLHAMYLGSRKMLIFLIVIFLALTITTGVVLIIVESYARWEELVLSGTYLCMYHSSAANLPFLTGVWVVIKHFRQLRRQSTGWTVRDFFMVLIKTHVLYFAAFAVASCFALGNLSPSMSNYNSSVGFQVYNGVYQIALEMQLFVLGPRLILSVRAHHAQLLANSDEETVMTTVVFQGHIHESTDSEAQHGGSLAGAFRGILVRE